jgi:hypothetical protein
MTLLAAIAKDAQLQLESGATFYNFEAGTNSGDNKKFTLSGTYLSMLENDGFGNSRQPVVRLDGIKTGGNIIPAVSLTDDLVDVAALTCFLAGVDTSVAVDTDVAVTRPAVSQKKISSVTVTSAGVVAVIAGSDSTDNTFYTARDVAGGPPYVPVGSIEIGLIKLDSDSAAPITTSEIFVAPELAYIPSFELVLDEAAVNFLAALPAIHTAAVTRAVYCKHYDPAFITLSGISNMVTPDINETGNDEITYGGIATAVSRSGRNTGSFDALLSGEPGDPILQHVNGIRVMKFFPDKFKTSHQLLWASYAMARNYPADTAMKATCNLIAIADVVEKSS